MIRNSSEKLGLRPCHPRDSLRPTATPGDVKMSTRRLRTTSANDRCGNWMKSINGINDCKAANTHVGNSAPGHQLSFVPERATR